MKIQSLEKYEEFNKIKEIYNMEFIKIYKKIEKIFRGGDITREGWYKINKLFDEKRDCKIYSKNYMSTEIIHFTKSCMKVIRKDLA